MHLIDSYTFLYVTSEYNISNGFIISILTAINVFLFYRISINLENSTETRYVKSTLFEACCPL